MKRFEWDDKKAEANAIKHGVTFETAMIAFDDPFYIILDDKMHSAQEVRQVLIGSSGLSVLVVVFTLRRDYIRIISARPASRKERETYEKGI